MAALMEKKESLSKVARQHGFIKRCIRRKCVDAIDLCCGYRNSHLPGNHLKIFPLPQFLHYFNL